MQKPPECSTGFKCINIFKIFDIKYECFYNKSIYQKHIDPTAVMKSRMKVCFYKYNKNMYYLIVSCETKFESTTHQVSLFNSSRSIKNTKETLKRGNMHIVYVRN